MFLGLSWNVPQYFSKVSDCLNLWPWPIACGWDSCAQYLVTEYLSRDWFFFPSGHRCIFREREGYWETEKEVRKIRKKRKKKIYFQTCHYLFWLDYLLYRGDLNNPNLFNSSRRSSACCNSVSSVSTLICSEILGLIWDPTKDLSSLSVWWYALLIPSVLSAVCLCVSCSFLIPSLCF